jgi:hypothetical protein
LKLAWLEERERPKWKGVEEEAPPRQPYSHSASVGKRYTRSYRFSAARAESFLQNSTASSQYTLSTGKSSVSFPATLALPPPVAENQLGLVPMTARYCFCVTSVTPR